MTEKIIRLATLEDAPRMLEIYGPNVLETVISFETELPSLQEFQRRISATLVQFPWIACEINGQIAGISLPNDASVALHERLDFKKVAQFQNVGFKLGNLARAKNCQSRKTSTATKAIKK